MTFSNTPENSRLYFSNGYSLLDAEIQVEIRKAVDRTVCRGIEAQNTGTNGIEDSDRVGEHVDGRGAGTLDYGSDRRRISIGATRDPAMRVVATAVRGVEDAVFTVGEVGAIFTAEVLSRSYWWCRSVAARCRR